ncbi:MAG: TIGR00730 family Rossman fold protein [Planctomycetaceae bacterium]|nr:TIGR00730 family Rossman fold protein [Planctomycetaceae bacterium]
MVSAPCRGPSSAGSVRYPALMKSVTVYCSSSSSLDPHFTRTAEIVGREIANRGSTLVYGGGSTGLMGDVARACAAAGGEVVGVITSHLATLEVAFEGCTELVTVETMRERKRIMVERGDAFLVLPGGLGTYEELFETLVGRVLSEHDKPMGIVNDHGYFDPLLAMIEHGIEQKFIRPAIRRLLSIDRDAVKVLHALATDRGHGLSPSDLIPPLAELEN